MRSARSALFLVSLASLFCLLLPAFSAAGGPTEPPRAERRLASPLSHLSLIADYHGDVDVDAARPSRRDQGGGIREIIPDKYKTRYQEWKKEFLSTEIGRQQWAFYESNTQVTLTIVVSRNNSKGAGTGQYKWDESGKLVAATITLGSKLNEGYPNPIYYPVMNSLMPQETAYGGDGQTLAAAKIAHEFGHLTRTAEMDHAVYELQNRLMPVYNKILLSNGRKVSDPRLIELAQQMGGTPVEIWEDREYWGEANAMLFLRDRFADERLGCSLFSRIRQSVDLYARNYTERFLKVARTEPSLHRCGWE